MNVNFALMRPTDIGASFQQGRQDVQNSLNQAQDRRLREQQIGAMAEQNRATAAERQAHAEQRAAAQQESVRRQQFLGSLKTTMEQNGHTFDRPTLSLMATHPDSPPEAKQVGMKGLLELDAEEKFQKLMGGTQEPSAKGFTVAGAQERINALMTSRDPRAHAVANALQRQIEGEQRREDREADNKRQSARDTQIAADRAEDRALRRELVRTRLSGKGGVALPDGGDMSTMTDAQILKLVGPGVMEVTLPNGRKQIMSRVQAAREGHMSAKEGNIDAKVSGAKTKTDEGREMVSNVIDELRANYDTLDRLRAIPNEQRNALSNVGASIGASGVGQIVGRTVGSKAQTSRDVISSSRTQLLNGIKQATGMSSQQLNSNVELRLWLDAVTDPRQSKQATDRILTNIETWVAKNQRAEGPAASTQSGVPAAAPARPAATGRDIGGGFRVVD